MDDTVAGRLDVVRRRVESACAAAGRDPSDVTVLAVSKGVFPESIAEAAASGMRVFGESRVREAGQKIPLCPGDLEWHMVGHLQTNKVRDAVRLFTAIHSIDSLRLLEAVESGCEQAGKSMKIFVEVNVAGESSKFGLRPDEAGDVVAAAAGMNRIELLGLMTIPPFTREPEGARPFFRELRELRDRLQDRAGLALPALSMGMSHDFEFAIEEGATWIRVGTDIFGKRIAGKE